MTSPSTSLHYQSLITQYIAGFVDSVMDRCYFFMITASKLKNINVIAPVVVIPPISSSKPKRNKSNTDLMKWKLRKNLETLAFLAELESRYDMHNKKPHFLEDCYRVKKEIQQNTLELTKLMHI